MAYNLWMENDKALEEFMQILGQIKDLVGDAPMSEDGGVDMDKTIENLRQSGNDKDADEIVELMQRADELKVQHQAKS